MVGNMKRCFFNQAGLVQCTEWPDYRKDQEATDLNANDFLKTGYLRVSMPCLTLKYSLYFVGLICLPTPQKTSSVWLEIAPEVLMINKPLLLPEEELLNSGTKNLLDSAQ
jgi:hypothetical protein